MKTLYTQKWDENSLHKKQDENTLYTKVGENTVYLYSKTDEYTLSKK